MQVLSLCAVMKLFLKSNIRKEDIGKKIWLKFASYNIFGSGEQSLDEVEAYEYILTAYYIPPVTNIRAYNRYRQLQDGVARYDIVVEWDPPELATYLEGQVWYKTDHAQADQITLLKEYLLTRLVLMDLGHLVVAVKSGSYPTGCSRRYI